METFKLNEIIVSSLNHWASSSLYTSNFVIFCGVYLGWLMLIFLGVYIYKARRRWTAFRFIFLSIFSALVALFIADLIKYFYPIDRPAISLPGITQIFIPADKASFPSMHMAFWGGLGFSLMWRKRRLGYFFLLGVVFISVARIAAGVHYPLDIIAGLFLGFVVSLFSLRKLRSYRR